MRLYQFSIRSDLAKAALCLILWGLAGCAVVGPSSISLGRASYNEAINKTEDEQLLTSIVRSRYGELYNPAGDQNQRHEQPRLSAGAVG